MTKGAMGMLFAGTFVAALCAGPLIAQAEPRKGPPPGAGEEGRTDADRPPLPPGPDQMRSGNPPEEGMIIDELKRDHPAVHESLMELRRKKPDVFRQKLWGLRPMLKDSAFRKEAIENIELELQLRKLVGAYRDSKDAGEKTKLKGDIRQALEKQFDAKLGMNERRLAKMEKEIVELKGRIEKRRRLKKDLIDKRLGNITGDEEGWDW